ncbi:hypothetical protein GCM10027570_37030 [Streptomonospora sediminis]
MVVTTRSLWEIWGAGRAMVLKRPLALFAVSRLAKKLYREEPYRAVDGLAWIAASMYRPGADRAFSALEKACEDPRLVGTVFHACLLQASGRDGGVGMKWSSVAAPLVLGGSPPRIIRFLDSAPGGETWWSRPEDIVHELLMCISGNVPRRPDLERFLSTTDQPLILAALAEQWDGTFPPTRNLVDVSVANPHLVPPDSGGNVLLAVAKDRPDLVDFTRAETAESVLRGTGLPRADLAAKYRRVLRALPPGDGRRRLREIAVSRTSEAHEARAAVVDAGYAPKRRQDRAVFFYLTEQWERYDAVDPDGALLYAAYCEARASGDPSTRNLHESISRTARMNARPDPADRFRRENPEPRRPRGRRGAIGGYSGDYGGGDYGGGSSGSGGFSGGGFSSGGGFGGGF